MLSSYYVLGNDFFAHCVIFLYLCNFADRYICNYLNYMDNGRSIINCVWFIMKNHLFDNIFLLAIVLCWFSPSFAQEDSQPEGSSVTSSETRSEEALLENEAGQLHAAKDIAEISDKEKNTDEDDKELDYAEKIKLVSNRDIHIPWFTMSPTVGYGFFMHSNLKPGVNIDNRHALIVKYSFNLGGRGFSSEIAPVYQYEESSNGFGTFHAVGLYIGINWRWRWWNFVPSAGFGIKTNYLMGENIEYGVEIYGRFPVSLTWYLAGNFNLILEFAPSYGVVGIKSEKFNLDELHLGHGFAIDFNIGTRFP